MNIQQREYSLMENSPKVDIRTSIPDGPTLVCPNSWDYADTITVRKFKTTTPVTKKHPLLKVKTISLKPISNKVIYQILILRQPESSLKEIKKTGNRNGHNYPKNTRRG